MTTNPKAVPEEVEQQEFYELALEAKQFLADHNIETLTDMTAGHMASWCQRHLKTLRQATIKEVVERLKREGPPTVFSLDEVRERNKHLDSHIQQSALDKSEGWLECDAKWRAALKNIEEEM